MKIAILGAPGAGKSKFATALAKELRKETDNPRKDVQIVDGYVDALKKRTGFEFSMHATYPQTFQIFGERLTKEQEALSSGAQTLIVVGSIYETIAWAGIRVASDSYFNDDPTIHTWGRLTMQTLGMLESLTFNKDILFFLPLSAKTLKAEGKSYATVLDTKLPEIVSGHFKRLVQLDGTNKKKVDYAIKTVRAFTAQQARESSVVDDPSVQRSQDIGQERIDPGQPVSNV